MKKRFPKISVLLAAVVITAVSLAACGAKTYKIDLKDASHVYECPEKAKAGEKVTIYTYTVTDADMNLSVDGVPLRCVEEGVYEFIMPEHDVKIETWVDTSGYPGA